MLQEMLLQVRGALSGWLDVAIDFLVGVQRVAERGLDQLHVEYGAQLLILRIGWGLVILLLVGVTRGYLRLAVLLAAGVVLLRLYGYV